MSESRAHFEGGPFAGDIRTVQGRPQRYRIQEWEPFREGVYELDRVIVPAVPGPTDDTLVFRWAGWLETAPA